MKRDAQGRLLRKYRIIVSGNRYNGAERRDELHWRTVYAGSIIDAFNSPERATLQALFEQLGNDKLYRCKVLHETSGGYIECVWDGLSRTWGHIMGNVIDVVRMSPCDSPRPSDPLVSNVAGTGSEDKEA